MSTVISVRIDKNVKEDAAKVAKSVGISLSTLINAYLRQVIITRRIELYAPEEMSPKLEKMIAEIESEISTGAVSQKFSNADEFLSELKK